MSLKNIDDFSTRWKDPKVWETLSDEQRNVINDWYTDRLAEINKRESQERRRYVSAGLFALIPFAVGYAYKYFDNFFYFLLSVACAWAVYAFVFAIYGGAFLYKNPDHHVFPRVILHVIVAIFATICVLGIIYE